MERWREYMPDLKLVPEAKFNAMSVPERMRVFSQTIALDGTGQPRTVYFFYAAKVWLYLYGFWGFFLHPTQDSFAAFQQLLLYTILWEVLGFGCGAGPLNAKNFPPVTSWWHWLRPGSVKLPPVRPSSLLGRVLGASLHRTWLDVALFAVFFGTTLHALCLPAPGRGEFVRVLAAFAALSLRDRVFFFACRAEVLGYMTLCCCFARPQAVAGCQAVQLAIWFGAGVSKCGPWFAYVLPPMLGMCPVLPGRAVRRALYTAHPSDLRPSPFCVRLAHAGTALELTFPLLLAAGGRCGAFGVTAAFMMHCFIIAQVPFGAPIEWNFFSVAALLCLFGPAFPALGAGAGALPGVADLWGDPAGFPGLDVQALAAAPAPLQVFLSCCLLAVPAVGVFVPGRVSFLLAFRYYAGNWAYSSWLVRRDAAHKLRRLSSRCLAAWTHEQLAALFDDATVAQLEVTALAGRTAYLPGRALPALMRRAAALTNAAEEELMFMEGELVAGTVLGWNFGDGFLSDVDLLEAVQEHCDFQPGELVHIAVEPVPLLSDSLPWVMRDAHKLRVLDRGVESVRVLCKKQPY